jgi:hypothetical protein
MPAENMHGRRKNPPVPIPVPPPPIVVPPPIPVVQSRGSADAFVDSIGVNTHFTYNDTAYVTVGSTVQALLIASGIRHIRDGLVDSTSYQAVLNALGAAGVRAQLIGSIGQTASFITGYPALVPSMEAFEGLNEPDIQGNAAWVADTQAFQKTLFAAAASSKLPVVGPSLTSESAFTSLGNIAASQTYGNMHPYFAARNPGTVGWGNTDSFGDYGSLAYQMAMAKSISGSQGLYATETGYDEDIANANYTISPIKVRYLLRTLLTFWNAGIVRTYLYEFLDDGGQQYGLLDSTGAPKASYVAIKNLIGAYADPGPAFPLATLTCAITASSTVKNMIAQKRNGSYIVALWNEVQEWDSWQGVPGTVTAAPAQTVTLTFPKKPTSVTASTFNDAGSLVSSPVTSTTGSVYALQVSGYVTLVVVTP